MNKKTVIVFVRFGVLFLLLALLVGKTYDIGLHRPPLMFANIPDNTRNYITELGRNCKDQGLTFSSQGPFDWDNDDDFGQEKQQPWKFEQDDNFIVYYQQDQSSKWQDRAQQVLKEANDNIDDLKDLFGTYKYANDMNGRKLAIYLPSNDGAYQHTVSSLFDGASHSVASTLGITITQIGPLGCLTKGIVISPKCFNGAPDGVNGYIKTLKHEMCHYMFFSSLDYSHDIKHYMWVSEGIAEYFCTRSDRHICGGDSIEFIERNCLLDNEFPNERNSHYWAGESFFNYLESKSGKKAVKLFLLSAFTHSTDSVFIVQHMKPKEIHGLWVKHLKNNVSGQVAPAIIADSSAVLSQPTLSAATPSQAKPRPTRSKHRGRR